MCDRTCNKRGRRTRALCLHAIAFALGALVLLASFGCSVNLSATSLGLELRARLPLPHGDAPELPSMEVRPDG